MIIRKLFLINILFVANAYSMHTPPSVPKELVVPGAPARAPHAVLAGDVPMLPAHLAQPLNFAAVHAPLVPPAHPIWAPLAVHVAPAAAHVALALVHLNLDESDSDESMGE